MSDSVFEVVGDAPANDATADFLRQERELLGDDIQHDVQQLSLQEDDDDDNADEDGADGEDDAEFLQEGGEPEQEVDPNATYSDVANEDSHHDSQHEDDAYAVMAQASMPTIESEPIREWRAARDAALVESDAAEQLAVQQMQEDAAKKLQEIVDHHAATIESTHKANMEGEKSFVEKRDAETTDHSWAACAEHIDWNLKSKGQKKDTSRLKSIMISLKA